MGNPDFPSIIDQHLLDVIGKKRETVLHLIFIDSIFRIIERSDYLLATITGTAEKLIQNKYKIIAKEMPIHIPNVSFYICWHKRFDNDLAHTWLRNQLIEIVKKITSA